MAESQVELLRRVPLFSDLERRELERIAGSMKSRTFRAGDVVTSEGSGGAGFFVIAEGEADVSVGGQQRRTLGRGDYFGEVALITGDARTATITARTDLVCYGMTPWDFKPLVETHGDIAWKLLQTMARQYQQRN